jgi:hypothetical protein
LVAIEVRLLKPCKSSDYPDHEHQEIIHLVSHVI